VEIRFSTRIKIVFVVLLLVGLFSVLITLRGEEPTGWAIINNERISLELATTDEERAQGLMFREELCSECGMLFIFEEEDVRNFWMKNTLIPLDIIFINKDFEVVSISHALPCEEVICERYSSKGEAMYVLETNHLRFSESIIGEKVTFRPN